MEKIKKQAGVFTNVKTITAMALFAALSIVLGKYLAINFLGSYRISLENLPIIVAAAAYGPIAGAIVGTVADLIGCVLVGYAINPIITAGAAAIGIITGLLCNAFRMRDGVYSNISYFICSFMSVGIAHMIGSVIIKTVGIYYYFPQPFWVLFLTRLAIYICTAAVEGFVLYVLYNRKIIQMFMPRAPKRSRG